MADADLLSTISAFLKESYPVDRIIEIINNDYEFYKNVKATSDFYEATGKYAVVPIKFGQDGNLGSRSEDESLPESGGSQGIQATIYPKYHYNRTYVSNQIIEQASSGSGSFLNYMDDKVIGMMNSLVKDINWKLFNSYTGLRTQVNGAVSSNTNVVVDSVVGLREGMKIDIYNSTNTTKQASAVEITNINEETLTLTLDTAVTCDNDGYIYQAGEKDKSMNGLLDCLATTGTFFGINKGTYSVFAGKVINSTAITITNKILTQMKTAALKAGAKPKFWLTTPEIQDQIYLHLLAQDQRSNTTKIAGGYETFSMYGYKVVPDVDCPPGYIFLVDTDLIQIHQTPSGFHWLEIGGSRLIPVSGKDSFEMLLKVYNNMFVTKPKGIPYAYNISQS